MVTRITKAPAVISHHRDRDILLWFRNTDAVQDINRDDQVTAVCQFSGRKFGKMVFQPCRMSNPATNNGPS